MKQKLIGYVRVSTDKQLENGAGIEAQIAFLEMEAARRNAELEIVSEGEGASGKSIVKRVALLEAMNRLDKGEADALIVSKLDRLARNTGDFLDIFERSKKKNWSLIIGDLSIDTSTPMGLMFATMSAAIAQFERERNAERTREGMAIKKAQGVHLGMKAIVTPATVEKIVSLHKSGKGFNEIARILNAEAIPTPRQGSRWHASTVSYTVKRVA